MLPYRPIHINQGIRFSKTLAKCRQGAKSLNQPAVLLENFSMSFEVDVLRQLGSTDLVFD